MTRTVKVVNGNETVYESSCTINSNDVKGSINPFPYINRKLRKMELRIFRMEENNGNVTLYVK